MIGLAADGVGCGFGHDMTREVDTPVLIVQCGSMIYLGDWECYEVSSKHLRRFRLKFI